MNTKILEWLLDREHHRGWADRGEEVAALKREKAELQLELAKVTEELVVSRMDSSELSANMLEKPASIGRIDVCEPWCQIEGGHAGRCRDRCETTGSLGARCILLPHHSGPCTFF